MNPARSTAGLGDDPPRSNQYDGAMRPIPLGAKGTFKLRVTPAHLANQFKDAMLPQVFATPMMVLAMENAALNAIRGYLDPGESAVGTAVDIRHIAATPVGHEVTAQADNGPTLDLPTQEGESEPSKLEAPKLEAPKPDAQVPFVPKSEAPAIDMAKIKAAIAAPVVIATPKIELASIAAPRIVPDL